MKKYLGLLVLSLLALTSCTQKNNNGLNPLLRMSRDIISTRAQNTTQFVAIVKLKSPALLEAGQKVNGRLIVDKDLLAQINQEQADAIAALKALSPQVQIIYQYKMVLNALAVLAPVELEDKIGGIGLVAYSERSGTFGRPEIMELSNSQAGGSTLTQRNSSIFIGAQALNSQGITGKGVRVGVIDTGIDYTHSMLGGVGTADAYKAIDPNVPNDAFPNKKVVGGIDLVGTEFDSASPDFNKHLPKPDMNPIDEAGHGSHVAGTIAGQGDGVNSYNGMAPDADLYAVKVFGAEGSTSDYVVIAALEYAADPNVDGNNDDQLNVVNLSLGSGYGNPHILYSEAIRNLVNGGTMMVAAAGNSGHLDYIVGAPGTADEALSVAASVDNSDHLWKFSASRFNLPDAPLLVEAIEAATTKKIADAAVSGELVLAGIAAQDFDADLAAAVKGKVALIDRGQVNFNDKIKRAAAAGAIGVVVANNRDGAAISMGTTDKFDIPAIMITLADGNKIKAAMKNAPVTIDFQTDVKIEKPELIDTLTDFTSKGPRSIDGAIKPEISAPGENIISAAMGQGKDIVQMSGTSMASPHVTGVAALLKQVHPDFTAAQIKALIMGGAKTIGENGKDYSVSLQGSGRIQADVSAKLKLLSDVPSLSLGEVGVETKKTLRRAMNIQNIGSDSVTVHVAFEGSAFVSMPAQDITVAPQASQNLAVNITLDASQMAADENIREMDGWIKFTQNSQEIYRIPVLAIAHRLSSIQSDSLVIESTSALDSDGAAAELTLENKNSNAGEAQLFNLIGQDDRKPVAPNFMTSDCDLQTAGYRIKKSTVEGQPDVLQIAVKLYKPMTTWNACDVSLMIDANGDGQYEQELLGSNLASIPGQTSTDFATTLLDASKARSLRKNFEVAIAAAQGDPKKLAALKTAEDYSDAIIDQRALKVYNNSSVVILEVAMDKLAATAQKTLAFKLIVTDNEQSASEFDDTLTDNNKTNFSISLKPEDQSYVDLPDSISLQGSATTKVELTKGQGPESLMLLMPTNRFSQSDVYSDSQLEILKPVYKAN